MRSVIGLAALVVASSALAQAHGSASGGATAPLPPYERRADASRALFDRLDKNKDGYLTGSELSSPEALTSNWISVDRDRDGRISRSEFSVVTGTEVAGKAPEVTRRP